MSANEYFNRVLSAIPDSLKDATGFSKQISVDVGHIVWMQFQHANWFQDDDSFLVVTYLDGFQLWLVTPSEKYLEVLSKRDTAVTALRILPTPDSTQALREGPGSSPSNVYAAYRPMIAYVQKTSNSILRLYSIPKNDVVHFLRLPSPISAVEATRTAIAVGMQGQVGGQGVYKRV
jgi:hypothetical protein